MKIIAILILITAICVTFSGCTESGNDPVIGTWEWSDEKGYSERYVFMEDQSFSAAALGSNFTGTWEKVSEDHYRVIYRYRDDPLQTETLTEDIHYDKKTDAIYFPAHRRVA
ncbi:MAG: hypothetical protein LUQ01_04670 [Methanolinea sp.]|nr:hypothetical protein [Methanolinea sp.]